VLEKAAMMTVEQRRGHNKARRQRTHSQIAATAFHEAGHIVIGWRLGFKPHSVTIAPSSDYDGQAVHDNPLHGIRLEFDGSDRARLRGEKAIKICLAGPLAQRRHAPRSLRRWQGRGDFRSALDIASAVCGSPAQAAAFLKWLEVVTAELVARDWPIIVSIASRLIERERLSAVEIKDAIAQGVDAFRRSLGERRG
jgi:hypothetical protein